MVEIAKNIVRHYVNTHFKLADKDRAFGIDVILESKVINNLEFIIKTSFADEMQYEVTYDGSTGAWTLEVFTKTDSVSVDKDEIAYDIR